MGYLLKIWTKPGASQQMESHESIESITGKGLSGCVGGKSKTRQVTVLSLKAWNEAQKTIGQQLDPINRRANFLVDEIDLENTKGMKVHFLITTWQPHMLKLKRMERN